MSPPGRRGRHRGRCTHRSRALHRQRENHALCRPELNLRMALGAQEDTEMLLVPQLRPLQAVGSRQCPPGEAKRRRRGPEGSWQAASSEQWGQEALWHSPRSQSPDPTDSKGARRRSPAGPNFRACPESERLRGCSWRSLSCSQPCKHHPAQPLSWQEHPSLGRGLAPCAAASGSSGEPFGEGFVPAPGRSHSAVI